jgi:hypothetical protein
MSKTTRAVILVVFMIAALAAATPASAAIRIGFIYYNPPGKDTLTNTQINKEYIRIHNSGTRSKAIGDWTIRDTSHHVYKFASSYRLCAKCAVTVHTGRGTDTRANKYWGLRNYVWNNTGDTATLKNASGRVVDRCHYTGTSIGHVRC